MIITKQALPRRTFLRGAGAAVALPLLDAMAPALTALARTPACAPRRLVVVYAPMGAVMAHWTPPGADGALTVLPPVLAPLAPVRDHLTVITGLGRPHAGPGTHAGAVAGFLSGAAIRWTEDGGARAGATIDQIAARRIGRTAPIPSLQLAVDAPDGLGPCVHGAAARYRQALSWASPTTPLPAAADPRAVFDRLFGGEGARPAGGAGCRPPAGARGASRIDLVRAARARLWRRLGPADRRRADAWLDAVRDAERRIQRAEAAAAIRPSSDPDRPAGAPAAWADHVRLQFALLALALQGDLTRVLTFQLAREASARSYPEVGAPAPHHAASHHRGDPVRIAQLTAIGRHHAALFGECLDALAAAPEGAGRLLDRTVVLYGSGMGDPDAHDPANLPIVVAGGGARRPRGGRHVRLARPTPIARLHRRLLDMVGVERRDPTRRDAGRGVHDRTAPRGAAPGSPHHQASHDQAPHHQATHDRAPHDRTPRRQAGAGIRSDPATAGTARVAARAAPAPPAG